MDFEDAGEKKILTLLKLGMGESSFENTMDSQENRQIIRQSHKFSLRGQRLDSNYPTSDTFESLVSEGLDVGKGEKKEKRVTSNKVEMGAPKMEMGAPWETERPG